MLASLSVRAIWVHPVGTVLMLAALPPWIAIVASIKSPVDTVGLLIVSVVVVTCTDDAVVKAPELIAANATALTHSVAHAAATESVIRRKRRFEMIEFLIKETARFFIKDEKN